MTSDAAWPGEAVREIIGNALIHRDLAPWALGETARERFNQLCGELGADPNEMITALRACLTGTHSVGSFPAMPDPDQEARRKMYSTKKCADCEIFAAWLDADGEWRCLEHHHAVTDAV